MPVYTIKTINQRNKVLSSIKAFSSIEMIYAYIEQNKLRLITYKKNELKNHHYFNDKDMKNIWLLLGQYIQSGYSLIQSFTLYVDSIRSLKQKVMFAHIVDMLAQGQSLSEAIASLITPSDQTIIPLLKAGEESGDYEPVFQDIHHYFQWKIQWKRGVQLGLRYPLMVLFSLWGCAVFLLYYLVPQLANSPLHQNTFSNIVLTLSRWTTQSPVLVGGGPFFCVGAFFLLPKSMQFLIKAAFLKMPGIRKLGELNTCYFFSQGMSLLLKNKMTIQKSLEVFLFTFSNDVICKKVLALVEKNRDGIPLWKGMQDLNMYDMPSLQLLKVGEETNHLAENFMLVALRYQSKLEEVSNTVKTMLEPVLIVGFGLLFLSLITSILSPIYESMGGV